MCVHSSCPSLASGTIRTDSCSPAAQIHSVKSGIKAFRGYVRMGLFENMLQKVGRFRLELQAEGDGNTSARTDDRRAPCDR